MEEFSQMVGPDLLTRHLQDLPYFRALIRAVEAEYYQTFDLPQPTLDVGCGDGHFASLAFERKIEVGLDPSHGPIQEAGRRGAYQLLVQADAAHAPFPGAYFASAFSNSVLEHIPHVENVLSELARILQPGAFFYFCVPNERYLSDHTDPPETWRDRLEQAGFSLERYWYYFSPSAMRVLEWGHYFGLPSWMLHKLTGRWILVRSSWNLWLTKKILRRYASTQPVENGTFTFFIARRN
jgi:SAM-dependent methyltransferase